MTSPAEATRRNAALQAMRQHAHDRGFTLGEVREVDKDTHIELIATGPDGRDFGIGYQKDAQAKRIIAAKVAELTTPRSIPDELVGKAETFDRWRDNG